MRSFSHLLTMAAPPTHTPLPVRVPRLTGEAARQPAATSQRGTGFPRTFDRNGDGLATIDIGSFEAGLPTLVINEIEADNAGSDSAEFIEIYDGGIGNTDLENTVLVFFDGSTDLSYHAIDLTGFSTNNEGYFLVGNSGVNGATATFPR